MGVAIAVSGFVIRSGIAQRVVNAESVVIVLEALEFEFKISCIPSLNLQPNPI